MARKPNYAFERNARAKAKAAKREAKRLAKAAAREKKAGTTPAASGAEDTAAKTAGTEDGRDNRPGGIIPPGT